MSAVEKGCDYGEVDRVLIDADIYVWALSVADGVRLSPIEQETSTRGR
ncbi:MAG: hypothetical protein ACRDQD_24765 [Nocardioidaceae bacterium]